MATGNADWSKSIDVTTNATPMMVNALMIYPSSVAAIEAKVVAKSSTDVHASWWIYRLVRRNGTGALTFIGSPIAMIVPQKDSGASSWNAVVVANGNHISVQVTGANATTITWGTMVELTQLFAV